MAISSIKNTVSLVLKYADGTKDDGSPKVKTMRYSIVSKDATDESIYNVGTAIGNLLANECVEIRRVDDSSLSENA